MGEIGTKMIVVRILGIHLFKKKYILIWVLCQVWTSPAKPLPAVETAKLLVRSTFCGFYFLMNFVNFQDLIKISILMKGVKFKNNSFLMQSQNNFGWCVYPNPPKILPKPITSRVAMDVAYMYIDLPRILSVKRVWTVINVPTEKLR